MQDIWAGTRKPDLSQMSVHLREFLSTRTIPLAVSSQRAPRISVVTPSFNQASYLERTLRSVLNQSYPNLELIVVDGGSIDGSVDILRQHSHSIAYWVSEADKGQSHAINKGLARCTGEWISFQNSDDIFLPGALHAVSQLARANPQADVITGHMVHIDALDKVFDVQLALRPRLWMQIALGGQLQNQATFWRRDLMIRLGALRVDMKFCFDYEYFTRLLTMASNPILCDRYLGAFRRHGASKTSTMLEVARREHAATVREYRTKANLPPYCLLLPNQLLRAMRGLAHLGKRRYWYLARRLPPPIGIGALR